MEALRRDPMKKAEAMIPQFFLKSQGCFLNVLVSAGLLLSET
jgi:hypothetical protein